jgi:hypothetical protein
VFLVALGRLVARTAGIGLAAGLGLALLATRAVRPLLYGVAPFDALTFGAVAVLHWLRRSRLQDAPHGPIRSSR